MLVVKKASIHPENISMKTRRNLTLFTGGMWVKSIFQQEDVCEFGGWGKERGENIKICLLTNGTSLGQIT